jgi:hypothetical protein
MRELIECASGREKRQMKAIVNEKLNSLRKRRKKSIEPEREDDDHRDN